MTGSQPIDSIRMQVMWDRLLAVVEEQAQTLLRCQSSLIRLCWHFSDIGKRSRNLL